MDNYNRSKFTKTSDYSGNNDIPPEAKEFLYCAKECRKNNKTYAGIMTSKTVLVTLLEMLDVFCSWLVNTLIIFFYREIAFAETNTTRHLLRI